MNNITETMLKEISNWNGSFKGAYNIRENGCSVGRQSSETRKIDSKTDQDVYKRQVCIRQWLPEHRGYRRS